MKTFNVLVELKHGKKIEATNCTAATEKNVVIITLANENKIIVPLSNIEYMNVFANVETINANTENMA